MSSVARFRPGSLMLQHLCHSIARESLSWVSGKKRVSISPNLKLKSRPSVPLSAIFFTPRTERGLKSHPSQSETKERCRSVFSEQTPLDLSQELRCETPGHGKWLWIWPGREERYRQDSLRSLLQG